MALNLAVGIPLTNNMVESKLDTQPFSVICKYTHTLAVESFGRLMVKLLGPGPVKLAGVVNIGLLDQV